MENGESGPQKRLVDQRLYQQSFLLPDIYKIMKKDWINGAFVDTCNGKILLL